MKPRELTLPEFLELGWSDRVRSTLADKAGQADVLALAAADVDGRLVAQAWTRWPDPMPADVVALWTKHTPAARPAPARKPVLRQSRTMQAVALVDQGMTAYAAAKQLGIQQSAVSRALARRAAQHVCPTCQQLVRTQSPGPVSL